MYMHYCTALYVTINSFANWNPKTTPETKEASMLTLDPILYKSQAYGDNVPYYVYGKTSEWETF